MKAGAISAARARVPFSEQPGIGFAEQQRAGVHTQRAQNVFVHVIFERHPGDLGDQIAKHLVGHVTVSETHTGLEEQLELHPGGGSNFV